MVKFNAFKNVPGKYLTQPTKMWELFAQGKIYGTSIGMYTYLTNRLSLSVKKGIINKNLAFYDDKKAQWFVYCSESEAGKLVGVTAGPASVDYKQLKHLGYIDYKIYRSDHVTKVYFPKLAPYLPQPKGISIKSSNTIHSFKSWANSTHKNWDFPIKPLGIIANYVGNKFNEGTDSAENIMSCIKQGRNQAAYYYGYSTRSKYFTFNKSSYINSDYFTDDLTIILNNIYQNRKNTHMFDKDKEKKFIIRNIKRHMIDYLDANTNIKPRQRKSKKNRSSNKPINKWGDTSSTPKDLRGDPSKPSGKLNPTSAATQRKVKNDLKKSEAQSRARRERSNKSNNSNASAKADHPSSNNDSLADGSSLSDFYNDLNNNSSASQSTNANKSNGNKDTNSTNEKLSDSENKVTSDELFSINQLKSMVKNLESYYHAMDSLHNQANNTLPFGHDADVIDAKKNQLKKAFKKHFKAVHAAASVE